jgi:endonuclease/exonuclease/phosphatase (EEP) superfamily protein YafD
VVTWALAISSTFAVAAATLLLWGLSDLWWPATVLLFGPRWLFLVPVAGAVGLAAARDRTLLLLLAPALWLVVGPLMGLRTGWTRVITGGERAGDLTVATLNVGAEGAPVARPESLMQLLGADVLALQECGTYEIFLTLEEVPGWHTWWEEQMCLISRFDILEVRSLPLRDAGPIGGVELVFSYRLQSDNGPLWVTNVHFATPREGLLRVREGDIGAGADLLRSLSRMRAEQQTRGSDFVEAQQTPRIVLGDFNTPVESRIYRAEWGRWSNAFSVAGAGFGATRLSGWVRARIDHVLVDESWLVVNASVGPPVGSDHLPMIATLRRR